jgi:hypothetical protein
MFPQYFLFFSLFICAYIVGAISLPCPHPHTPPLFPNPLASKQNLSALFSNFAEE